MGNKILRAESVKQQIQGLSLPEQAKLAAFNANKDRFTEEEFDYIMSLDKERIQRLKDADELDDVFGE